MEVREIIHAISEDRRCIMRTAAPADLFCLLTRLRATSEPGSFQVRYFARRYRYSTYNGRGYPPSDVPDLAE